MIELEGLHKRFGNRIAVEDLTLRIPRGRLVGLLGHNGAGKSTALGMLLGQVFPDRGTARIGGADVFADRRRALARVGAIYEAPAFYGYLSGWQNLQAFTAWSGPVSRRDMADAAERVGLADRIHDRAGAYSHGMRQRLALAQALLPRPEVLILDEPGDGLDPEGIHEMREMIRSLHRDLGLTVLLSSHLLTEVQALCTDLVVMRQGRMVFQGDWRAAGGQATRIRLIAAPIDRALALLEAMDLIEPGVGPDGLITLRPQVDSADLAEVLVKDRIRVMELHEPEPTLESFYLALSAEPDGGE